MELVTDSCPSCGSTIKDEPNIACIRSPKEDDWHETKEAKETTEVLKLYTVIVSQTYLIDATDENDAFMQALSGMLDPRDTDVETIEGNIYERHTKSETGIQDTHVQPV